MLTVLRFIQSTYILTALEQDPEMAALLFGRDICFQLPVLDMFVNIFLVQHYSMKLAFQVSS